MKWPFVRISKYNHLMKCLDIKNGAIVDQMENIKKQFNEINRLNQELANEMNSHRETKELWQESLAHNDLFLNKIKDLEKELEETKEALKIAQEENIKLNDWISKNREASYLFVETIKKAINNFTK